MCNSSIIESPMNSDKQAPNLTAYQQPTYEDEISLVDIIKVLLRRKKLILGVTATIVCIGLLYAFTTKRVYQVDTLLSPPSDKIIQTFNLNNLQNVNKNDIYSGFTKIIESRAFRNEFFNKSNVIETLSDIPESKMTSREINNIFEAFNDSLKVIKDTKNKENDIEITLEGTDKDKLGRWLDDFVAHANSATINQVVNKLRADVDYKIKKLTLEIKNKRLFYNQIRKDELGRLIEAYNLAKDLGIVEYKANKNVVSSKNTLSIYMGDSKRYMDGTRVLQAEINALKNRKSDDIHIEGLRNLQEQLIKLEAINVEKNNLEAATVDKKAIVNINPIRPNRKLIVILSLILGGMLGIFAVFIMEFMSNFKKQVDNVNA